MFQEDHGKMLKLSNNEFVQHVSIRQLIARDGLPR